MNKYLQETGKGTLEVDLKSRPDNKPLKTEELRQLKPVHKILQEGKIQIPGSRRINSSKRYKINYLDSLKNKLSSFKLKQKVNINR